MNKVRRNDTCPCGSKKKYKKCHNGKPLSGTTLSPAQRLSKVKDAKVNEPVEEKVYSTKGIKGGLCNVSRCMSPVDVNYCNEWNGNTYYCLNCAIDFTLHDKEWTQGYRFNSFVPHPLLCDHKEITWFIEKGNTFTDEVRKTETGYDVYMDDTWHSVNDETYRTLIVTDGNLLNETKMLIRPEVRGHSFEMLTFHGVPDEERELTGGVVWEGKLYRLQHNNYEARVARSFTFDKRTDEVTRVVYE